VTFLDAFWMLVAVVALFKLNSLAAAVWWVGNRSRIEFTGSELTAAIKEHTSMVKKHNEDEAADRLRTRQLEKLGVKP
jgi:hypothetical protein